ncbi:VanZ family protein [Agromyces badenianii]|nr:VanZ family protein [Agromyces badenianii]
MDETEPSPHEGRDELSIDTPDRSRAVRLARWFLPPYLIAVGLIVFLPAQEARRVTGLVGWLADVLASLGASREVSAVVVEFLANIALFVPMGVLLALAFPTLSWWVVLAVGCLATVGIELVQLALPTRYSTLSDIIANTTGTALGLLLLSWWARARQRRGSDRSPT